MVMFEHGRDGREITSKLLEIDKKAIDYRIVCLMFSLNMLQATGTVTHQNDHLSN